MKIVSYFFLGISFKSRELSNDIETKHRYFSLNPSFQQPTLMTYLSSKRHIRGNDILLPCLSTGAKPMLYTWTFNGKDISRRHRIKFAHEK